MHKNNLKDLLKKNLIRKVDVEIILHHNITSWTEIWLNLKVGLS